MLIPSFSMKLHCILSIPLSLFSMLSVFRLSDRFCGHNNIEMGRRTKMYETEKSSLISTVSQLFLHGIVEGDTRDITKLQPSFGNQFFIHLYKVVPLMSDICCLQINSTGFELKVLTSDQRIVRVTLAERVSDITCYHQVKNKKAIFSTSRNL